MAGVKGRSGRKPGPLTAHVRNLLAETMSDSDWRKLFRDLRAAAAKGDERSLRATELLMRYGLGPARPADDEDSTIHPLRIIEFLGTSEPPTQSPDTELENVPPPRRRRSA